MKQTKTSYAKLRLQLDELLSWFEQDDLDVDEAIQKYEQALKLTQELETYLQQAENSVKQLTS